MTNNILRFWQRGSKDPLEPLFDTAPILLQSTDGEGKIDNVSQYWSSKLGYDREEMIGKDATDFLTEDHRQMAIEVLQPEFSKTGRLTDVECDYLHKSGAVLPVRLSTVAQYSPDGRLERSLAIIFDASGASSAHEQSHHRQRLEAIGQLVSGVAHDFNNLLYIVRGTLELLLCASTQDERTRLIATALQSVDLGTTVTQKLLTYARKSDLSPTRTDLNAVIAEIDPLIRRLMPSAIRIVTAYEQNLWPVMIDRHRLDTALLNILTNARDAMPEGGRVTIETCNATIDRDYIASRTEDVPPGPYVMLAITDTGTGIEPGVLGRIFEPYFTTKPPHRGAGLGLAMVYGFVKQSGGLVRVYSEPGVGTSIKLYFPAGDVAEQEDESGAANSILPPATKRTQILVVEDDPNIRGLVTSQLIAEGLETESAGSGDRALAMIRSGLRPKVMITDIVMPGKIQGPELARQVAEIIPGIRIAFVSGYPREATLQVGDLEKDVVQLVKPLSRAALLQAVKRLLQS